MLIRKFTCLIPHLVRASFILKSQFHETPSRTCEDTSEKDLQDLARGCIIGALCGDALGSYLEFQTEISDQQVKDALTLPGGGPFDLGRGQITDDGELSLCLGHGLSEGNGILDLNKIGAQYRRWYESYPFDMGITTRNALSTSLLPKLLKDGIPIAKIIRKQAQRSKDSQSNGSLMRITPLCVWASKLSKEELITAVTEETQLTHSNQTAIATSIAYVYTIQHLLSNKGDYNGAYMKCQEIAEHLRDSQLSQWMREIEEQKLPPADHKIGWAKIAFCYSLHYLKQNTDYYDAMKEMLKKGGDTDTNCCIVGGMLGALHGIDGIPKEYVEKLMHFGPEQGVGQKRPEFLTPKVVLNPIISKLIEIRPQKLTMKGHSGERL